MHTVVAIRRFFITCAAAVVCFSVCSDGVTAQTQDQQSPFRIVDNSFLVEEAFNQDDGVFQTISTIVLVPGTHRWENSLVQEWPMAGIRHQLSYTIPFGADHGDIGLGDMLVNYRYQLTEEHGRVPAFAPRVSLVVPTGNERLGFGDGKFGFEFDLPFSKRLRRVYFHWNTGMTVLLDHNLVDGSSAGAPARVTPLAAGSIVLGVRPLFNLIWETLITSEPTDDGRERSLTLLPGFRVGWDTGKSQVVVGLGVPVTRASGVTQIGVLGYLSFEAPFRFDE